MTSTSLVFLKNENLYAFANERIIEKETLTPTTETKYVVGKQYSLNDVDLEEINEEKDIYELVGIVNDVNGISFQSLVMKPIHVDTSLSFSLTRQDCQKVGVEYQEGLQLFPMTMDWQPIAKETPQEENREFNPNNLATYPVDRETKTIKKMMIRLTGFSQRTLTHITTPFDRYEMPIDDFLNSLSIRFKPNCGIPNITNESTRGVIVTKQLLGLNTPPQVIVDNDSNSIFIELDFSIRDMSTDNISGISPTLLENKSINDIITISWIQNKNTTYDWDWENLANKNRGYRNYAGLPQTLRNIRRYNPLLIY